MLWIGGGGCGCGHDWGKRIGDLSFFLKKIYLFLLWIGGGGSGGGCGW